MKRLQIGRQLPFLLIGEIGPSGHSFATTAIANRPEKDAEGGREAVEWILSVRDGDLHIRCMYVCGRQHRGQYSWHAKK
jgi:hypothetical protein